MCNFQLLFVALKDNTYTVWTGCLVVAGRGVCTLIASAAFSGCLLRCWSFWKMLIPGCTRLKLPPSRMYTCSGVTSSQRGPWKPERHTQVCGLLQEPRFWQGGWQSAEERAQMHIKFSAGYMWNMYTPAHTPHPLQSSGSRNGFPWSPNSGSG